MKDESTRNSPVKTFVSRTESFVRLVPFSQVKSANANGSAAFLGATSGSAAPGAGVTSSAETSPLHAESSPAIVTRTVRRHAPRVERCEMTVTAFWVIGVMRPLCAAHDGPAEDER